MSSAPRLAPSRVNWTPATATLSAAVALTGMVPWTLAPPAGELTLTVGGVPSGGGGPPPPTGVVMSVVISAADRARL